MAIHLGIIKITLCSDDFDCTNENATIRYDTVEVKIGLLSQFSTSIVSYRN
jgi:hypothetical protein